MWGPAIRHSKFAIRHWVGPPTAAGFSLTGQHASRRIRDNLRAFPPLADSMVRVFGGAGNNRTPEPPNARTFLGCAIRMTEIRFGTDGWRGIIADDFTFANVRLVAQAIARR